ncbi:MAG: GNAT family N-acetyltransferase [Bacillota bacterium]
MNGLIRVKELLDTQRLIHVSHLKMLEEYENSIEFRLIEKENAWGGILLIPVASSSFDIAMYQEAKHIVYLAGSDEWIIHQLVKEIPSDKDLVFKIHNSALKDIVEKRFPLTWKKAYLSYTCHSLDEYENYLDVIRSTRIDKRLLPLWAKNGYSKSDIEKYFAKGASSFSIYKDNEPISTCLIFHNCYNIWEVGTVHTIESERGKGFAKKVVNAALNEILKSGNMPKYQVVHSNLPSIKLAESLGMQLFLKLEHYYFKAAL